MYNGYAISIAWPETKCKQTGAWYDLPMKWIGFNRSGYYKVGHAAIILVDMNKSKCHYFDFGRYHSPAGMGRIRSSKTDHELFIFTKPIFDSKNHLLNIAEILLEISKNKSSHGTGKLIASISKINFPDAHHHVMTMINKTFIPYGPFVHKGTNCSRFVNSVLLNGKVSFIRKSLLYFPIMLTPTPMWNIRATAYFSRPYQITND